MHPVRLFSSVPTKPGWLCEHCADAVYARINSADPVSEAQIGTGDSRWETHPTVIEDLKAKARSLGLWNMFLPAGHYKESPGYTNVEYGLMAEWLGKSRVASEAVNCAAPDTGNMEVLAKYGNEAQKREWLVPLMEGKIRSAFLMTEPEVASSDARNIELSIRQEGNEWVLNGTVSQSSTSPLFPKSYPLTHTHNLSPLLRNGGPQAPETPAAACTSRWASPPPPRPPTGSNP